MRPDPRDEEVERPRRCVALLAEALGDVVAAVQSHEHQGEWGAVDHGARLALDRARGKLDALGSSLGIGAGRGGRGEGVE